MTLDQGAAGHHYRICSNTLPFELKRRMEALGMTQNSEAEILHKKRKGTAVILLRSTRFALGQGITSRIEVEDLGTEKRPICEK